MEHAFGREAPFAVGMEEELLLADPTTLALAPVAGSVVPEADAPAGGTIMYDVYQALVETSSPISATAVEGARSLDELRAALRKAGATLLGAGIHPAGTFGDAPHVPTDRYREIGDQMRGLLRRTPTAALHVHVGMPDAETAIAAANRMRAHLPLLQALAAHSPYWHGVDSGFATARAQLFRGYPRGYLPRAFSGWEDYAETMTAMVAAAGVEDYTHFWWDVRPHPRLGTLEIRAMDAQARIGSVLGLGALVHALALACVHEPDAVDVPVTEALVESSFRAGRNGLDATIWSGGALRPVRDLAAGALSLARPYARDLGADGALEEIERILLEGNGADRMRLAHARGGMRAALAALAADTAAPLGAVAAQR